MYSNKNYTGYAMINCDVLYLEMTAAPTDKAETLAGADSSRTLNESYHSSDYSIEEDPQEESAVATARPGDFRKAEPGLRQPLVCECTHKRCHYNSMYI